MKLYVNYNFVNFALDRENILRNYKNLVFSVSEADWKRIDEAVEFICEYKGINPIDDNAEFNRICEFCFYKVVFLRYENFDICIMQNDYEDDFDFSKATDKDWEKLDELLGAERKGFRDEFQEELWERPEWIYSCLTALGKVFPWKETSTWKR